MTKNEEKLIKTFYQGLATEEEKSLYKKALKADTKQRVELLVPLLEKYGFIPSSDMYGTLISLASLTEEELVLLLAAEVRKGILAAILSFFKKLFGG